MLKGKYGSGSSDGKSELQSHVADSYTDMCAADVSVKSVAGVSDRPSYIRLPQRRARMVMRDAPSLLVVLS